MQIESQKNCLDSELLLSGLGGSFSWTGWAPRQNSAKCHMPKDCSEPCQIKSDWPIPSLLLQRHPPRKVPPTRLSCATSRHPRATVKHSCREGIGIGHKQNDLAVLDFNSTLHWSLRPSNASACSIVSSTAFSSRLNRTNKSVILQCYNIHITYGNMFQASFGNLCSQIVQNRQIPVMALDPRKLADAPALDDALT